MVLSFSKGQGCGVPAGARQFLQNASLGSRFKRNLSGKRDEIFKRKPGRDEYSTQGLREKLEKSLLEPLGESIPLLPVEWDATPSPRFIRLLGQFTSIYLYSWLERSAVRVKRIAPRTQHNDLVGPRLRRGFNH